MLRRLMRAAMRAAVRAAVLAAVVAALRAVATRVLGTQDAEAARAGSYDTWPPVPPAPGRASSGT